MSRRCAVRRGVAVVLAALPLYLESFWLQTGLFAMAAIDRARSGSRCWSGIAGQLSLAHAFFVAIGAYGYATSPGRRCPGSRARGLGLPPLLALVGAVALAGLAGALFSPIAGRVRGIYLGLASLGLVFLGQHILQNATGDHRRLQRLARRRRSACSASASRQRPGDLVDPRRAVRAARAALVPRPRPRRRRDLVRPQPRPQPPGPRAGDACATARSRPRSMGIDVVRYKAAAFTVSLDVRGPRRRADGARLRAHRARVASASCCRSTSS